MLCADRMHWGECVTDIQKERDPTVSTIWHRIRIGDELVLINIHHGKVKFRLFDLDFKVVADKTYEDDEVDEVVSNHLGFLTNAAVASAAWEAQQRKQSKNGVDGNEKN